MVVFHDSPLYLPSLQNNDLHLTGSHISGLRRRPRFPQDIIAGRNMVNPVRLRSPDGVMIPVQFQISTVIVFIPGYPLLLDSGVPLLISGNFQMPALFRVIINLVGRIECQFCPFYLFSRCHVKFRYLDFRKVVFQIERLRLRDFIYKHTDWHGLDITFR